MQTSQMTKENPTQYKYVKILKVFMYSIGAWPGEVFGEKMPLLVRYHQIHCPIQTGIVLIGQIAYLKIYSHEIDFMIKGTCFITTFLGAMTLIRSLLPYFKKYGKIIYLFMMEFHLGHYKYRGGYYKEVYDLIDKASYYYTLYLVAMTAAGMFLFNISHVYENFVNGAFTHRNLDNITLEFGIYYTLPGFDPVKYFKFVTIFNFYLSFNCSVAVCSIDLLLSVMVFQIIGHVQILRNNLTTMPTPSKSNVLEGFSYKNPQQLNITVKMFDDEENKMIHKLLVECVQHHKKIVHFTEEMSSFFGPVLGINYAFHLVSCCLLLMECSAGGLEGIIRYGSLTIIIFGQLIQISVIFEIVGTVSEKLKEAVYETPWEYMDSRNRRSVCILLNRVQTPIHVTAMDLTTVGVTTMAGILKTTFSYFAFLRSLT